MSQQNQVVVNPVQSGQSLLVSYLDRATTALAKLNIVVAKPDPAPVVALLDRVAHYDNVRVTNIAATLQQSSAFNEALLQQDYGMDIANRFQVIIKAFESLSADAVRMANWTEDFQSGSKPEMINDAAPGSAVTKPGSAVTRWRAPAVLRKIKAKAGITWMNVRRGSVPQRFREIRKTYIEVADSNFEQINRELAILEAYHDFRLALKSAEVDAQEVLKTVTECLNTKKAALDAANANLTALGNDDGVERSRLELARDVVLREVRAEEKAFQLIKNIADDLKTGYSSAELIYAKVQQNTDVKEMLYARTVSFYAANETAFTGIATENSSSAGLGEATNAFEAFKSGMNEAIGTMAKTGTKQLEAGIRSAYGATLSPAKARELGNSLIAFQESLSGLVSKLRIESTEAAEQLEATVEETKQRYAALISQGA